MSKVARRRSWRCEGDRRHMKKSGMRVCERPTPADEDVSVVVDLASDLDDVNDEALVVGRFEIVDPAVLLLLEVVNDVVMEVRSFRCLAESVASLTLASRSQTKSCAGSFVTTYKQAIIHLCQNEADNNINDNGEDDEPH